MSRQLRQAFLLPIAFTLCHAAFSQNRSAPSLNGQQPQTRQTVEEPQGPAPEGATVLKAGTQLVIVDVIVHDKKGKPVHGLTRNDFALSESRVPQKLSGFEEYSATATPVSVPPAPKLPPGTFTDYTPVPVSGPLNVLLIDALNTPLSDQSYLMLQLREYVKHAPGGTRIAVFGLVDHLYFLQGFSSDPAVLQATIEKLKGGRTSALLSTPDGPTGSASLTDTLTPPSTIAQQPQQPQQPTQTSIENSALMTNNIQTFVEQIGVAQIALRSQETIESFTQLGHWLANFPGRKNLIWFSAAFPLSVVPNASVQNNTDIPGDDSTQFRAMTNVLTRAQVSVYPIDPRGVQVDSVFDVSSGVNQHQPKFQDQIDASTNQRSAEHATMQTIASDTGGEPFYGQNDLSKAVAEVVDMGGNYYTLVYAPSEHKTSGEWRGIHVELTPEATHAGLSLSYRHGYFADNLKHPDNMTATAEVAAAAYIPHNAGRTYAVQSMTRGAPMPNDILFTTRVLPHSTTTEDLVASNNVLDPTSPLKPPFRRYDVDCLARPGNFKLTQRPNGNYAGSIALAVFVYSVDGKLLNTVAKKLVLDLTPENYAKFQKTNIGLHLEVSTPAHSDSVLRIGLQDVPSNHIGVVEVATASVSRFAPTE